MTTVSSRVLSPPSAVAPRLETRRGVLGVDVLLAAVIGMICTFVWRVQVLWPSLLVPLRLAMVCTIVAVPAWLISTQRARSLGEIMKFPASKLVLLLGALVIVSTPLGMYPRQSLEFVRLDYLTTFLFFFLSAAAVRSFQDVERLAMAYLVGAVIFSLVVLTRYRLYDGRLSNLPSYDANDFAMLLCCMTPLAVYFLAKRGRLVTRLVALGALMLFIVGLVRSGSRGGFLAMLVIGVFLLVKHKGIPVRLRLGAISLAVLLMLGLGSSQYWELMGTILDPKSDYNWSGKSDRGRMEVWKRGVGYMMSRPLTGVGPANFEFAEGRSQFNQAREAEGRGWAWAAPHNSFVEIGAELGVTGLLLFVALLYSLFRYLSRAAKAIRARAGPGANDQVAMSMALFGSLLAYVIAGFFLTQGYSEVLYGLLGMAVGHLKILAMESAPAPAPQAVPSTPRRGAVPSLAPARRMIGPVARRRA